MNNLIPNHYSASIIVLGGIIAGAWHVFSGPDHLAAIAPLAMNKKGDAWLTGLRWGGGHASGVIAVGIISILLRGFLAIDLVSQWSDRLVGVLLLGMGLWTFRKALQIHTHAHEHGVESHMHIHMHGRSGKIHEEPSGHLHKHAAFGIGTLHGLAGSSHFLAIIPSLAMPSNSLAVAYLAAYGAGTVGAMMVFSSLISSVAIRAARATNLYRALMFACSGAAIVTGSFWVAGLGF